MPTTVNLAALIAQNAQTQGVPPAIALAVAQQESSISQWTKSGGLVTGPSGEIGVFQLLPSSFPGVDSADVNVNIATGISYLKQLFLKYGDWSKALSAYNSGSPTRSTGYANSVLAIAGGDPGSVAPSMPVDASSTPIDLSGASSFADSLGVDPNLLIIGGLVAVLGVLWWVTD